MEPNGLTSDHTPLPLIGASVYGGDWSVVTQRGSGGSDQHLSGIISGHHPGGGFQLLVCLVGTDIFTTNTREWGAGCWCWCWDKLLNNYHNEMMMELRAAADTIFFLPTLLIYKNRETVTEIKSLSNRISRWVTYVCLYLKEN